MPSKYKYSLDKGSKKHNCPNCGKKRFVYYVDLENDVYLPHKYGKCDRADECQYHLNPYVDGYCKNDQERNSHFYKFSKTTKTVQYLNEQKDYFIPFNILKETLYLSHYSRNTFIQNLLTKINFPFSKRKVEKVIALYYLGTISKGYMNNALTLPFIDIKNKVRAVQVKQFDQNNHTIKTNFLHSILKYENEKRNNPQPQWLVSYLKNEKKISCLFGEHLLSKYPSNPVAIVEAPKTAIYCTLYFGLPTSSRDLIWLAVYNKSSFSFDKLKVLKEKEVYVFPDLSKDGQTYREWENKAHGYEQKLPGTEFTFSNLLEKFGSERLKADGADIADILIKYNWKKFRDQN